MMYTKFIGERFGLPAFHSRRHDRRKINCPRFNRDVTPNRFEALPPEQLAGSRDMLLPGETIVVVRRSLRKGGARNSQFRIEGKLSEKECKIVFFK